MWMRTATHQQLDAKFQKNRQLVAFCSLDHRRSYHNSHTGLRTYATHAACLQVFSPLVEKCKRLNRAMRIGTNHGSLSARILSYYGDTPRGMVESAFEFANICRSLDYHNFLFSMKASNPLVMVQAYRLLSEEMYSNGWDYPLHLGVTEVTRYAQSCCRCRPCMPCMSGFCHTANPVARGSSLWEKSRYLRGWG